MYLNTNTYTHTHSLTNTHTHSHTHTYIHTCSPYRDTHMPVRQHVCVCT